MYLISEIATILSAVKQRLINLDVEINELIYDSRKVIRSPNPLFFALSGARDGHQYVSFAYAGGVRNFVISQLDFDITSFPDANFIWVEDVWAALRSLAMYHRERYLFPIIGITGSNGKTVVKEWLFELLSPDKRVYQSPKSYNSQLGVALSLWGLNDQYDMAIIEAGISQPGEMIELERMIRPDIGVFTSLGVAHAEGFESKEYKRQEKMILFRRSQALIGPSKYMEGTTSAAGTFRFSWGVQEDDQILLRTVVSEGKMSRLTLIEQGTELSITVPFADKASVENVLTCISVMRYLGYAWEVITDRIRHLKAIEMRLQLKSGINNCSIIDDSYSNDLASLKIALDFLILQRQHVKRTVILSEMSEVPDHEKHWTKLINLLSGYDLDRLIWVGVADVQLKALDLELLVYPTVEALIADWFNIPFMNETILVKGGRKFQFEHLVKRMTAKSHGTVLEINLNAIESNLHVYRSLLPKGVKLMAMVKAFSYGSGSFEVANMLQYNHVDYLTVAFVDEGVELRRAGISLPIMVLSPDVGSFDNLVGYDLEPEIYSFGILQAFLVYLEQNQISSYPIHIKLDTGMHRLGFMPGELNQLETILKRDDRVCVKSVFSHLVASGNSVHDAFTQQQIDVFGSAVQQLEQGIGYGVIRHLANTAGIVRWPGAYFDMVRLGIGLYGVDPVGGSLGITSVSVLKTTITQVKTLPAGETVGYDRMGVLKRDSLIATVKIGYADGYDRRFGYGVGQMKWRDVEIPTVGSICMDMCMLDVTGLDVQEGDEIVVYPDLIQAASRIQVIPYELLVNISARVKRVYYY